MPDMSWYSDRQRYVEVIVIFVRILSPNIITFARDLSLAAGIPVKVQCGSGLSARTTDINTMPTDDTMKSEPLADTSITASTSQTEFKGLPNKREIQRIYASHLRTGFHTTTGKGDWSQAHWPSCVVKTKVCKSSYPSDDY
jgi:hypothetical protein